MRFVSLQLTFTTMQLHSRYQIRPAAGTREHDAIFGLLAQYNTWLFQRIIACILQAGSDIRERHLAKAMRVSRLRDARVEPRPGLFRPALSLAVATARGACRRSSGAARTLASLSPRPGRRHSPDPGPEPVAAHRGAASRRRPRRKNDQPRPALKPRPPRRRSRQLRRSLFPAPLATQPPMLRRQPPNPPSARAIRHPRAFRCPASP